MTIVPFSAIRAKITPEDLRVWDGRIEPKVEEFFEQNSDIEGDVVVMVGKFEPPHEGHAFGMQTALKLANKINGKLAIVLGSPEHEPSYGSEENKKYPFSFEERVKLLKYMAGQLGLDEKEIDEKITFIHKRDVNDNKRWGNEVVNEIEKHPNLGRIAIVMANDTNAEDNPRSVWGIFKERGNKLFVQEFFNRIKNRATNIRELSGLFAPGGPHQVNWQA